MSPILLGYNLIEEVILFLQSDKVVFVNNKATELFGSSELVGKSSAEIPLVPNQCICTDLESTFQNEIIACFNGQECKEKYFTVKNTSIPVKVSILHFPTN